jgi:hypothetical protein
MAQMQPRSSADSPRWRRAPVVTGIVYCIVGFALASGGLWLAVLGGSLYYVIAGLGILLTGGLLIAGRRSALWVYAAVLIGTLAWAIGEIGFDWWPLAARGDVVFPLGHAVFQQDHDVAALGWSDCKRRRADCRPLLHLSRD